MGKGARRHVAEHTDAVMTGARVLVAAIASSVAEVEDQVTLPQLRVLVMAETLHQSGQPLSLMDVANGLGIHPSNATRTRDRLVMLGLLDRRDNPEDRRQAHLRLTRDGERLIAGVRAHRRAVIERVLQFMPPAEQQQLAGSLRAFAEAAHEAGVDHSPALAWSA